MKKYSMGGRERIPFHSSARQARTEVQTLRNKRDAKERYEKKSFLPPTEKQLELLDALEQMCLAAMIPCEREFQMARQTKAGATGTIKKVRLILRQRGINA